MVGLRQVDGMALAGTHVVVAGAPNAWSGRPRTNDLRSERNLNEGNGRLPKGGGKMGDAPASAAGSSEPTEDAPASAAGSAPPIRRQVGLSARVNLWSTVLTALAAVVALILSVYTSVELRTRSEASVIMPKTIRVYTSHAQSTHPQIQFTMDIAFAVDRKSDVQTLIIDALIEVASPQISHGEASVSAPWMAMFSPEGEFVSDPNPILVSAEPGSNDGVMMFQGVFPGDVPEFAPGRWDVKITIFPFHQKPIVVTSCLVESDGRHAAALNRGLVEGQRSSVIHFYKKDQPMASDQDTGCYDT